VLQLADSGYVVGGSDMTQRVLPALGFREVGKATRYVRPLHPLKRLTGGGPPSWRTVAQWGRSALWAALAPSASLGGWMTSRSSADVAGDKLPLSTTDPYSVVFQRTPALFTFLASCPLAQVRLVIAERNQNARGYFLLAEVPGQVRIVDCWLESNKPSDWRDLYLAAVAEAHACSDAAEVVTMVTDDLRRDALLRAGFHARGHYPIRFFTKNPVLNEVSALRCEMIDSDALYVGGDRIEFWA